MQVLIVALLVVAITVDAIPHNRAKVLSHVCIMSIAKGTFIYCSLLPEQTWKPKAVREQEARLLKEQQIRKEQEEQKAASQPKSQAQAQAESPVADVIPIVSVDLKTADAAAVETADVAEKKAVTTEVIEVCRPVIVKVELHSQDKTAGKESVDKLIAHLETVTEEAPNSTDATTDRDQESL